MKPGTMKMYFAASGLATTHKELNAKGVKVNDVKEKALELIELDLKYRKKYVSVWKKV